MEIVSDAEWHQLSPEEKRRQLYLRQVKTLNDFLERGAISKEQYEKSFSDLTEKMGMDRRFPCTELLFCFRQLNRTDLCPWTA